MKKIVFLSFISAAVIGYSLAAANYTINSKSWEDSCQSLRVINVCSLTDHDLHEIMQGHRPEIAVEFSAQTLLPISFFLKGDLLNLVEKEKKIGKIEIKQSFYVRCIGQELILSSNLIDWKPFLEFITGTASIELTIQDGQPSIVVGAETNRSS